jgi:four helix bundle protein
MRNFKNYDIWKLSHKLTLDIYKITQNFPKTELYNLISQIRRASTSIPTNISEGCGRDSDKEFNRFLTIAIGSATEVEYLILLSRDLKYIEEKEYMGLDEEINIIKRKIYTLKQKLK